MDEKDEPAEKRQAKTGQRKGDIHPGIDRAQSGSVRVYCCFSKESVQPPPVIVRESRTGLMKMQLLSFSSFLTSM
jgi:hypothetical protein